jgi:hypothetical protein
LSKLMRVFIGRGWQSHLKNSWPRSNMFIEMLSSIPWMRSLTEENPINIASMSKTPFIMRISGMLPPLRRHSGLRPKTFSISWSAIVKPWPPANYRHWNNFKIQANFQNCIDPGQNRPAKATFILSRSWFVTNRHVILTKTSLGITVLTHLPRCPRHMPWNSKVR